MNTTAATWDEEDTDAAGSGAHVGIMLSTTLQRVLEEVLPGTAFQVDSKDPWDTTCPLNVHWVDGPTVEEVRHLLDEETWTVLGPGVPYAKAGTATVLLERGHSKDACALAVLLYRRLGITTDQLVDIPKDAKRALNFLRLPEAVDSPTWSRARTLSGLMVNAAGPDPEDWLTWLKSPAGHDAVDNIIDDIHTRS